MKKGILFLFLFGVLAQGIAEADVVGRTVEYRYGDAVLEGYIAYDDAIQGKRPAVMVVHEWKGLNEYARHRADMLAEMGYLAFAIDMYGKGQRAETHEEAAKLSGVFRSDRNLMRVRARAAMDFLKQEDRADMSRVAAIGYCFGGSTVLEMARAGFDLKGVASFHGGLSTSTPAEKGKIKAKVIAFHGDSDPSNPPEAVEAFKKETADADADLQFVSFSNTFHSFTVPSAGSNPASGLAYNPDADRRSWAMLRLFLEEVLAAPAAATP